mgnify:CR=1 FL=1
MDYFKVHLLILIERDTDTDGEAEAKEETGRLGLPLTQP